MFFPGAPGLQLPGRGTRLCRKSFNNPKPRAEDQHRSRQFLRYGGLQRNTQHSPDAYGVFDLVIGSGTVVSGTFSVIDWGSASHFAKIEMDETGGTSYQLMGTMQLISVPYALYANTALMPKPQTRQTMH